MKATFWTGLRSGVAWALIATIATTMAFCGVFDAWQRIRSADAVWSFTHTDNDTGCEYEVIYSDGRFATVTPKYNAAGDQMGCKK